MQAVIFGLVASLLLGDFAVASPTSIQRAEPVTVEDIVLLVSKTDSENDFDGSQIFGQGVGVCNPSSIHVKGFATARFAKIVNLTNQKTLAPTCRAWQYHNCTGASSEFGQNKLTALSKEVAGKVGSYSCP